MENRFLGLIEKSIKSHWNQPAFSDYKGETFLYRDLAIQIAQLHILFDQAGIKKGDKIALVGRNSSHWGIVFFGIEIHRYAERRSYLVLTTVPFPYRTSFVICACKFLA